MKGPTPKLIKKLYLENCYVFEKTLMVVPTLVKPILHRSIFLGGGGIVVVNL